MEKILSASEELREISKNKRIPNAILLYGKGKNKLKTALSFCRDILTSNEEGEKKIRLEKTLGGIVEMKSILTLIYILYFLFPLHQSLMKIHVIFLAINGGASSH